MYFLFPTYQKVIFELMSFDGMSFQEQTDPLIEKIQHAIDELRSDVNDQEFEDALKQINAQFPFVDLSEFLEMYVGGEYTKVLIERFHISGYVEYQKLLQILKLPKNRKSTQKTAQSREINLKDRNLAKRYKSLKEILSRFLPTIKTRITYNVLRAIVLFQLYSNMHGFTNKDTIIRSISNAVTDFERLILAPHVSVSTYDKQEIQTQVRSILDELRERDFLEGGDSGKFRLRRHQLNIHEYVLNTIRNREGITHQELGTVIKDKIPLLSQMPLTLFQIVLHELLSEGKIIKKDGYWKLKPSYDEYFTPKYYRTINFDNLRRSGKNQKFFGRKISPDEFVNELRLLNRGDFEDQDDQVTRIAGMILANSPMMSHPPNELEEFDFAVDLSNYKFTEEQQNVMQEMEIEIQSRIVYVKVMIEEPLTIGELSNLILKLKERDRNEQGFVVSLGKVDSLTKKILKKNKTIQLISERELKEWCKITPIIPSRRGAVAIVKKGHRKGEIVKIKSINYESGKADVVLLSNMRDDIQYIGSLEEITLDVPTAAFIEYSSKYFEFLRKLYQISKDDVFRTVLISGTAHSPRMKKKPDVMVKEYQISCELHGYSKASIDFMDVDTDTLRYTTADLFSCTCFGWEHLSKKQGLCEHLAFILNESVKVLLSSNIKLNYTVIDSMLRGIEQRIDLFLRRLRYANYDGVNAVCPNCGCVGKTIGDVEGLFGYRQMEKNDKFSLRRQSRCKKCRREYSNTM